MSELKKVTLFKIKPGVGFDRFLKGKLADYDHVEDVDSGYEAYVRYVEAGGAEKTEDAVPWLKFLNSGPDGKQYRFLAYNKFPRAIMGIRVRLEGGDDAYFAATFGQHGDSYLDKSQIVYDFGIKVGMNICDVERLRRVQTSVHESISKQTERQASVGASLSVFGINTESEFLRTISGYVRAEYAQVVESFRGKDSISIKLPKDRNLSWADMARLCAQFNDRYKSDDYRNTEFKAYDYLRHENDPAIIADLDARLSEKIASRDFAKIHLSPPEFMDSDDVSFAYKPKEEGAAPPLYDDLRIEDLVAVPKRRLANLTSKTLRSWKVYKYEPEQDATFPMWNAYECLVAEIERDGKTYVLANGQWREVSQELKDRVQAYFGDRDLSVDAPYLPDGVNIYDADKNQNREDMYNAAVVAGDPGAFLFDKAKILIADKRHYEVCDILHADRHFVHVKKYSSGSASISHIFTQAKLYSHAFATDEPTRRSMREHVEASDLPENDGKDRQQFVEIIPTAKADLREGDFTVIFCILHADPAFSLSDLPFMAQYELMLSHRFLTEDRSFKVGVAFRRVELGAIV